MLVLGMGKPPPPAIRYLVLLGAVALLGTAVCTKSDKANGPEVTPPVVVIDAAPAAPAPADAGVEAPNSQAVQPQQQQNPAPNSKSNRNNPKKDPKDKEEFFPASKSGGMF